MTARKIQHQSTSLHGGLLPAPFARLWKTMRRRWNEHEMLHNLDAMPFGAMKDIGYRTSADNRTARHCANRAAGC